MTAQSKALELFAQLDTVEPNSVRPDDHIILVNFGMSRPFDDMLEFATSVVGTGVRQLDCGSEGVTMMFQFKKIWLVIPETELLFFTLKYAPLLEYEMDHQKMAQMLTDTLRKGNENIFIMMSLIGFAKNGMR